MGHLANMVDAAAEVGRKVSVGLALTAAASPLFPLPATAQQVAANAPRTTASAPAPDFSKCDAMSQVNPKGAIACRVKVLDASAAAARQQGAAADARGAAADVRGAAADVRTACANEIGELRRHEQYGAKATEIARELVKASGRPAIEYDSCSLRDGIREGLVRQKLLPSGARAALTQ